MARLSWRPVAGKWDSAPAADWRHESACKDEDPELFFPVGGTGPALLQAEQAKAICRRCPVREQCGQWADEQEIADGVWGGVWRDGDPKPRRPAPAPPVRVAAPRGVPVHVAAQADLIAQLRPKHTLDHIAAVVGTSRTTLMYACKQLGIGKDGSRREPAEVAA